MLASLLIKLASGATCVLKPIQFAIKVAFHLFVHGNGYAAFAVDKTVLTV